MAKKSPQHRDSHTKESHLVIQDALLHVGKLSSSKKKTQLEVHREIAKSLNISPAMLYKWREAPTKGSGHLNPLDRVATLISTTGDERIVDWLAHKSGGHFTKDEIHTSSPELFRASNSLIKDFSLLITEVVNACEDEHISPAESVVLREKWNSLRKRAEGFVRACEKGTYGTK
jgi:hypothetical protein